MTEISQSYEDAGNYLADQFYVWLLESPNNESIMRDSLYDAYDCLKKEGKITGKEGYTGFMVGWAANKALRMCGKKEGVPNPAIMTIEVSRGKGILRRLIRGSK